MIIAIAETMNGLPTVSPRSQEVPSNVWTLISDSLANLSPDQEARMNDFFSQLNKPFFKVDKLGLRKKEIFLLGLRYAFGKDILFEAVLDDCSAKIKIAR